MAEAEDVITDVARHATVYAQALWRRHRATHPPIRTLALPDVAQRIDLLIAAVFGTSYRLRTAQAPAHPTFLAKALQRRERPRVERAIPATDGVSIWLPYDTGIEDPAIALDRFRAVALQQAMRASSGQRCSDRARKPHRCSATSICLSKRMQPMRRLPVSCRESPGRSLRCGGHRSAPARRWQASPWSDSRSRRLCGRCCSRNADTRTAPCPYPRRPKSPCTSPAGWRRRSCLMPR